MQRLLWIGAAVLFGITTSAQADVSGAAFQVAELSTSSTVTRGAMNFDSSGAFDYASSSGATKTGYYLEQSNDSFNLLYSNGMGGNGFGYGESLAIPLGTYGFTIIYGVTVDPSGAAVFAGYALTLPGFPTLPFELPQ